MMLATRRIVGFYQDRKARPHLNVPRVIANSSHKCNFCGLNKWDKDLGKEFVGCFIVPRFSRPVVQQGHRLLDLRGCHGLEVGTFGEELPQEAVGILVNPPLPGGIRRREVRLSLERGGDLLMLNELAPIIEGERLHLVCYRSQESDDRRLD